MSGKTTKTKHQKSARRATRDLPLRGAGPEHSVTGGATSSAHTGVVLVGMGDGSVRMGDGSVRFVSNTVDLTVY